MAAVETTWLSPLFDRMNVLSKAIKVSPVFAQRDGWRFDDHDEKQYIDPEWTVIPVIWQIFTRLLAPPVFLLQRWSYFTLLGRNWSKQQFKQVFIFINMSQVWLGHNLWNIGLHYRTHECNKEAFERAPREKKNAFSTCILIGCRHTHPYVFSKGKPFPQGFPHISTACLPWLYLQSKTLKRVH